MMTEVERSYNMEQCPLHCNLCLHMRGGLMYCRTYVVFSVAIKMGDRGTCISITLFINQLQLLAVAKSSVRDKREVLWIVQLLL